MKREKRWRRKSLSTTLKRETNEEQERGRNTDWEGGEDGQCEEKRDRRADNKLSRVVDRQVRVNEQTLKNS